MARQFSHDKEAHVASSDAEDSLSRDGDIIAQTRVERVFNTVQFFALSITFMSSWEAVAGNLYTVFYNGGPQTLVWGFLLVWAGAMAQAASLAEMASVQPISGAMYHWTYALAPLNIRRFTTWMQGWITWAGWLSMTMGIGNSTAYWITSLVQLNFPNYQAQLWHSTLMIWAVLLLTTSINLYKFGKLVPWIETVAGCLHVSMFVVFSIVLLALGPKHNADFVFFSRVDSALTSGWTNDFVSWNLGLQTSVWCFVGFDSAVHLAEEVRKPAMTVPSVMVLTILINGAMAWLFILVILFTMGNPDDALNYPQPMLAVMLNATGSARGATAMGSLLVVISICAMIVNVASMSRLSWSWARDGALPKVLAYVDSVKRVPARAVLLSVAIVVLLSLVNIGSSVALQVFISLSTLAMYISYFIAILMMFLRRFGSSPPQMGPWTTGRLGLAVNAFALIYTAYAIIWLPFPTTMPFTGANFNYSSPILAAVVLIAVGWWFVKRNSWPGLREDIIEVAITKD
ncbi:hypothetical protein CBER1_07038 [Cercospora berteroae]|uniref:Amino acid permease/ SLC12A domain-containing protein n=1 Tax=Cercospora berteroae TaxID=357750 RepID=A0A2S6C6Z7_9PEZI|nr:hypothetical protein CBER1_07038 [Cercospora berteroae]